MDVFVDNIMETSYYPSYNAESSPLWPALLDFLIFTRPYFSVPQSEPSHS
jgi:hypothetical protein